MKKNHSIFVIINNNAIIIIIKLCINMQALIFHTLAPFYFIFYFLLCSGNNSSYQVFSPLFMHMLRSHVVMMHMKRSKWSRLLSPPSGWDMKLHTFRKGHLWLLKASTKTLSSLSFCCRDTSLRSTCELQKYCDWCSKVFCSDLKSLLMCPLEGDRTSFMSL